MMRQKSSSKQPKRAFCNGRSIEADISPSYVPDVEFLTRTSRALPHLKKWIEVPGSCETNPIHSL